VATTRGEGLPHQLAASARTLIADFNTLLNGTICDGMRLNGVPSFTDSEGPIVIVGYKISPQSTVSRIAMPVGVSGKPSLWLGFSMRLAADADSKYLMVSSSVMYVATSESGEPLFHIDYERDKPDGHPESHIQINATSDDWESIATIDGQRKGLPKLHFPAGGRRYRPTLEDLIRFLIGEGLVVPRNGWESVVDDSARQFAVKQLRAAVRADPHTAIEALRDHPPADVDLSTVFSE